jgi:Ni/Co efflux regulator RcnB
MKRIVVALIAAAAVFPALAAAQTGTMTVFVAAAQVQERKDVDDATKNALKAKRDATKQARKDLEKQLKDQLGKKRDTWPPEKDEALYALEEAEALARADYEYRKIELKGINDSAKDIVESIQGKGTAGRKERVAWAPSAAEADLLVEVLARRGEKTLPTQLKPDWCFVLFTIGPGGKMDPARFAAIPANYRIRKGFGWGIYKIAGPSAESPVFKFETNNLMTSGSWGSFGCYGTAANAASAAIDRFIEDNHPILTRN